MKSIKYLNRKFNRRWSCFSCIVVNMNKKLWLDRHSGAIQAITTLVLVVINIVLLCSTFKSLDVAKKALFYQQAPKLILDTKNIQKLKPFFNDEKEAIELRFNFPITNIAKSEAVDVEIYFKITSEKENIKTVKINSTINIIQPTVTVILYLYDIYYYLSKDKYEDYKLKYKSGNYKEINEEIYSPPLQIEFTMKYFDNKKNLIDNYNDIFLVKYYKENDKIFVIYKANEIK